MAPCVLLFLGVYYLEQIVRHTIDREHGRTAHSRHGGVIGVTTGLTTFPAARLSDRYGRKRMIYMAIVIGIRRHGRRDRSRRASRCMVVAVAARRHLGRARFWPSTGR